MAAKMEEKKTVTSSMQTTTGQQAAANGGKPYTGLKTQTSYTPSDTVTKAQQYLEQVNAGKPGDYNSNYKQQLSSLYDQIMQRPKFSYDLNGDMLYQQYKDQYQTAGRQAMQDTMGQAAALTGGYGSSYASTAGNQAYQGYLQKLNDIIPSLYDRAYNAYQDQGTALQNQYSMALNADALDYNRYQDRLNQWNTDRSYAQNAYDSAYSKDYADYQDTVSQYQYAQSMAYDTVTSMIKAGGMPTQALLDAAGISLEDAQAYYNALHAPKTTGGSGKKKTTPTTTSGNYQKQMLPMTLEELGLIDNAPRAAQVAKETNYTPPRTTGTATGVGMPSKFLSEYAKRATLKK